MKSMNMSNLRNVSAIAACLVAGACSGGSGGATNGTVKTGGDLLVLKTEPQDNGRLFLNEPIRVDFTNPIDIASVDLNSFTFLVSDLAGNVLQEPPFGEFRVTTSPGDSDAGRRLEFVPTFPTSDSYGDGGFKPGRRYTVQIIGGDVRGGAVIRDTAGKTVRNAVAFTFTTATGVSPSSLFRDTQAGGPRQHRDAQGRLDGFSVLPGGSSAAALSLANQPPVEVRLRFDQPLNPASTNVPRNVDPNPTKRDLGKRGRVYLEYDDPDPLKGKNVWIPATLSMASNTLEGSELVLRPVGVFPNNATVRVIVDNTLEDISGESNANDASYNRVFATFQTDASYQPQFDAIVNTFDSLGVIDVTAPFLEPQAELNAGFLRSSFQFEGSLTTLDYEPTVRETLLNTDFTQITPKGAPPVNVTGGVFEFRNVRIPSGSIVRGEGSRPMVWLVSRDFVVEGELSVNGRDGEPANKINAANVPTAGGAGVCGGGTGGKGSPNSTGPSLFGGAGNGANEVVGGGGKGGQQSCIASCGRGSGGGGGSNATAGDPNFYNKSSGNAFVQQKGTGGYGCTGGSGLATRTLPGGNAGPTVFTDVNFDNNFWGVGIDIFRQIRISGELSVPVGGQGGGAGGNKSPICDANPVWQGDSRGGGGGGGAGVLIIKALGSIKIGSVGKIRADGGQGGGGEPSYSNASGGGGGAGAGGMVILIAGRTIEFEAHGETYANANPDFAISADGNLCNQNAFGGSALTSKYQGNPTSRLTGLEYDRNPTGGFGGMGLVELMAPPGSNTDGTNTVLDDNIIITKNGVPTSGTEKKRYLAWRGFPDASGGFVEDSGAAVTIGDAEGDIRPAPLLMSSPILPKSKARSRYIDTGATLRRETTSGGDGLARGIESRSGDPFYRRGPEYTFAGTAPATSPYPGYVDYAQVPGGVLVPAPIPDSLQSVMPAVVTKADASGTFRGRPAYAIDLAGFVLGSVANRYANLRGELLAANDVKLADFRILGHEAGVSGDRVYLANDEGALPTGVAKLRIVVKYFSVVTDGAPGLGRTFTQNGHLVPAANVRIGFAFHEDATRALTKGTDTKRLPQQVGTFLYDLSTVAETIRTRGMPYVQWEVEFNTSFSETDPNNLRVTTEPISQNDPRPELHFLVLPYRF